MHEIRVMVVDDHHDTREALSVLIRGTHGLMLCGVCDSGNGVTERVTAQRPDVILMDLNMPLVDGIEATRTIKKNFPGIQILVQTVFEDEEKIFAAISAGASGYVLKSTQPAKLVEAVFEIYNGGSPMSPSIARKVLGRLQQDIPEQEVTGNTDAEPLSVREKDVLLLLTKGWSYKMIADELNINYETVRSHMKNIYRKLHVASMTEAVVKALRDKIV
jgi:DNA-binding NarL/FixJ family response regulator